MSFGFLSESALLPSQSKSIRVDGRSLVDLKAVVYAKEQKVKQGGSTESGHEGLRGLRGKRASAAAASNAEKSRKDVFARSNRGVEDRSGKDEKEFESGKRKRKNSEKTMLAKARLYEKLAKGEAGGSDAGCLVDFNRKSGEDLVLLNTGKGGVREGKQLSGSDSGGGSDGGGSSDVDITDEFGRDRIVRRGGRQHREWLMARKADLEQTAKQSAEAAAFDERYSYRGNTGAGPRISAVGEGSNIGIGQARSSGSWVWGTGEGRVDAGDFETRQGVEQREGKKIAELLEREGVVGGQHEMGGETEPMSKVGNRTF
ncbi:unnamed protein product [Choristocarpus tenellus]